MARVRIKSERRYHIERPIAREGLLMIRTGCDKLYGGNRVAERHPGIPLVKDRCRCCDACWTQHRGLFANTTGAALPEKGA